MEEPVLAVASADPDAALRVRYLEERSCNSWPALQTVLMDGWLLRFGDGFTKRSNSAMPQLPGAAPVGDILAQVEMLYGRAGLPPIFRLIPPLCGQADKDTLDSHGYMAVEESLGLAASLAAAPPIDGRIVMADKAPPAWLDGYGSGNRYGATKRPALEKLLAVIKPRTGYALLVEDGRPVAYGLGVIDRGELGIFDILVEKEMRGRGLGRRLVGSLMGWGRANGAHGAYLQVLGTNSPAIALYRSLGFQEAYRYDYWIRPQDIGRI